MNNIAPILPEIFISLSIMFLLHLGVFKKNSSIIVHYIMNTAQRLLLKIPFSYPTPCKSLHDGCQEFIYSGTQNRSSCKT